ncbi:glutamine--fructose-6-phosphate transaminase (isomerizing) [Anaerostipes sp. MSJ-23]|uniref:glutamine--fructose-6-phosphate transaminase (isomerizing) n=1 Tax=Anaerostipes sp. MSJ-23 TaxID=2841520 RepID=UPI001C122AE4|nr:glutamine--fructose-6-phosphate transaminase (isomerizing) [Anaerostipes sp. MSJ-23]MBU5459737.1 glutamine--fructose-6-phosphate transaminase (isomerizing) [Anaerostipes sp. MSJ-23]
MCGIIGFTGKLQTADILVNGLEQLEYRGYDSAGIAVNDGTTTRIVKTTGKVSKLREKVAATKGIEGTCGIGHTRWATHGGVTDVNAHPHVAGKVTLIHNGIIENYKELTVALKEKGYTAISETDTEVAAMLIDSLYNGDPFAALREADKILEGAYGFCVMFEDHPGEIYCMRNASPLVASYTEDGAFIASDMVALLKYTKDYFVVPEEHIVVMTKDGITLYTMDEKVEEPKMLHVDWDTTAAQKGGYDYFMQKEIYDQPEALHNTVLPRIHNGHADFSADNISDDIFKGINRVVITACGTAWHSGLIGRHLIESMLRIPVTVELSSEFRYMNPILDENTLVIVVTQSGETADSLAALRLANERGAKTISIVNVKGSSIARESDYVLYTHAGPEIAVASTKAFSVQCAGMYLIALKLAEVNHKMTEEEMADFCKKFEAAIDTVPAVLKMDDYIKTISEKIKDTFSAFYLGRSLDYGIACEGCLKLKEISYVNAEAYSAGELKHGTISLITEGVPVIAVATQENVLPKLMANVEEVKARGAHVIMVTDKDMSNYEGIYDDLIQVPNVDDLFGTFGVTVALQLLAYHVTVFRGYDVDQPRNLAKSVTVE